MSHIVDGRSSRAERNHTSQAEADWLTAEELGKHLNLSGTAVRELLVKLGHGSLEAKKPTEKAFSTGLARRFTSHGKHIFKWNRKAILPELKDANRTKN